MLFPDLLGGWRCYLFGQLKPPAPGILVRLVGFTGAGTA